MIRSLVSVVVLGLSMSACLAAEESSKRVPILLDTDLGSDIDDAFALALAVASPEVELVGVTTVGSQAEIRAKMACRLLHAVGRPSLPVAAGSQPQPQSEITGQHQYYNHPAVIYNRAGKPVKESAVEFLYQQLQQRPGELTIVAIGPLTNIARLLKEHPDARPSIKRLVVMGGSLERDYDGQKKPVAEWNIKSDIAAAQAVFASGVPLVVVPLDATWDLKLDAKRRQRVFEKCSLLTLQVQTLYQMWNQETPVLHDPLAVAAALDGRFCRWEKLKLAVTDSGLTQAVEAGEANAEVALAADAEKFLDWYVERLTAYGETSLPKPPGNRTELITDNVFPASVQVCENYETDIEKRWWMAGRAEEKNVPPGSRRACRSQLTLDFDDLQGQLDTMYSSVTFNPVPGPPMGARTRLKFRYLLEGTDTLRVQIYSLSNGYHRYLSVTGLPQGSWQEGTVDMTAARRPDGSGGALAKDERIDDIQFYVDPRATVLIDDIILYDAGDESEGRPFPQQVIFTGWFDTGKQGAEWPGKFEIVPHEAPRTWKAAKSIVAKEGESPQLVVHLRGERPLPKQVELSLRYKLEGKLDALPVALVNSKTGQARCSQLDRPVIGDWQTAVLKFPAPSKSDSADELRCELPPGATLWIDDVLLYEPRAKQE